MKSILNLKNNKYLLFSFIFLIVVSVVTPLVKSEPIQNSKETTPADTIIPKGYVLIPIELRNFEAFSAVMGEFAVIDLYSNDPAAEKSKKLAARIKLIRAPYNPNMLAALVKEDLAERIMKENGPFFAVLQNRSVQEGNNAVSNAVRKSVAIEYQKETP